MGQVGRRRWPYVLLALAVLIAAGLVGVDLYAKGATEQALANDVRRSTHARDASVTISSFPFLYGVTVAGQLHRVDVVDMGVPAGPVRLEKVRLQASDVRFDRNQLVFHRVVHITAVGSATITVQAHLSSLEGSLARDFGVQASSPAPGRIAITAGGRTLTTIDLTRIPIVPSCPLEVSRQGDLYTFSCTVSPVPPSVLAALSKAHHI